MLIRIQNYFVSRLLGNELADEAAPSIQTRQLAGINMMRAG
jgi:hypothetical protein